MEAFYKPFEHQQKAIDAIFDFFKKNGKGNPLVVAPGGSGKSIIAAEFCRIVTTKWPKQRILVLSDDQEILRQDYKAIKKQVPEIEIGLYSASLRRREVEQITVAAIQSIYNKPELFTQFDICIVDEAHKISYVRKSRYRKFFDSIDIPMIGLTATPFRNGTGYLHLGEDAIFDDLIYTIRYKTLQDAGILCNLVSKDPKIHLDATEIKKQAGDYIIKELSMAFDRESITSEIVQDLLKFKELRHKWLVYAIDIDHCEHIAEKLNEVGISSTAVHSKNGVDRSYTLDKFRAGDYQALVSVAMLTTGVDVPEVDLIALLRPTASPVLHSQIIFRGARVAPGKDDCLVLDYAGNLKRNGPIDKPVIKIAGKGGGEAIMKTCENCDELVHIAVRTCPCCGATFTFQHHLSLSTSNAAITNAENWHDVTKVEYRWYMGTKNIAMMMVDYTCGLRTFSEPVCIEHGGRVAHRARHWWKRRSNGSVEIPNTALEATNSADALKIPVKILVNEAGKYDQIKEHRFE